MKYQVGGFTIDTARYRVSDGDTAVPVEPKVFDLLVHLIRHRDRVMTREELFKDVWEGREVSDATLSNHVKSARKLLGDNGDLQQTIQTVRSRGLGTRANTASSAAHATACTPSIQPSNPCAPRPDSTASHTHASSETAPAAWRKNGSRRAADVWLKAAGVIGV